MMKTLRLALVAAIWFTGCSICFIKQGDLKFTEYIRSLLPATYHSELRVLREERESTLYSLRLYDGGNFNLQAQIKEPRRPGKIPAIVLLGGMMTGQKAVEYAYEVDNVLLIAPDYPYTVRARYNLWQIIKDIPAAHQALHLQIRDDLVLLSYLRNWDRIDSTRISLIGYSFGVPFACAAAAVDRRINGLALIYGGADLKYLLRLNFKRYHSFFDRLLTEVFWFFLSDFEPSRQVRRLDYLPLLCLNGRFDAKIPRYSAQLLQDSIPFSKTLIWLSSDHVRPDNQSLSRQIIQHLQDWFHAQGLD